MYPPSKYIFLGFWGCKRRYNITSMCMNGIHEVEVVKKQELCSKTKHLGFSFRRTAFSTFTLFSSIWLGKRQDVHCAKCGCTWRSLTHLEKKCVIRNSKYILGGIYLGGRYLENLPKKIEVFKTGQRGFELFMPTRKHLILHSKTTHTTKATLLWLDNKWDPRIKQQGGFFRQKRFPLDKNTSFDKLKKTGDVWNTVSKKSQVSGIWVHNRSNLETKLHLRLKIAKKYHENSEDTDKIFRNFAYEIEYSSFLKEKTSVQFPLSSIPRQNNGFYKKKSERNTKAPKCAHKCSFFFRKKGYYNW